MKKYYKIAGLTVEMESFGRTVKQAEPYEIDPIKAADVRVEDTAAENYIVVISVLYLGLIVLIHRDKVLFSDPADRTCFNRRVKYSSAYKTFYQHICTSIFIFQ